ncbi:MAG: UDP-3-O-(3-hydroxymyristoyl)glucosamine N-acyltransferase [Nitrospirae bacterium]|nr:UDP-3-O-(3-hydroxymyristoyl)glucosamine N-acyltransferase [Nitrospirota bacterium]
MKLRELAALIGGRIEGSPDVEITGVAGIENAKEGDITFIHNVRDIPPVAASALIVNEEIKGLAASLLIVGNPQFAFARALEVFYVKPYSPSGISDKAVIGSNVRIGDDVSVYPNAYIGDDVELGQRVTISPGVFLGKGVTVGDDSFIHPNVTIREKVKIGKRVIVHSGTVIGSDGFGYVPEKGRQYKIPQVGGVIVEDDVEIGANACIDRATVGNTIIGGGTKIDNLVQVAHNVKIGRNCIIVALAGISGSVEIGDGAIIAGQVGIKDHVKIGAGAIVAAQAGITGNIPAGQIYSGTPAIPHGTSLRAQNLYSKLPEFAKRIRAIEKKLDIAQKLDEKKDKI